MQRMSDGFLLVPGQPQLSLWRHREAWAKKSFIEDIKERNVPRPPLKCGSDKECEHGLNNVVKVEAVTLPGVVPSGCYVVIQQKQSLAHLLGLQKVKN